MIHTTLLRLCRHLSPKLSPFERRRRRHRARFVLLLPEPLRFQPPPPLDAQSPPTATSMEFRRLRARIRRKSVGPRGPRRWQNFRHEETPRHPLPRRRRLPTQTPTNTVPRLRAHHQLSAPHPRNIFSEDFLREERQRLQNRPSPAPPCQWHHQQLSLRPRNRSTRCLQKDRLPWQPQLIPEHRPRRHSNPSLPQPQHQHQPLQWSRHLVQLWMMNTALQPAQRP